jgi:hypothetical protein
LWLPAFPIARAAVQAALDYLAGKPGAKLPDLQQRVAEPTMTAHH